MQEVVYERQDNNNEYYYDNVVKTNQNKSLNQLALSAKPTLSKSLTETVTTTTTTPQEGTVTTTSSVTISPQLVFDYTNLVRSSSGSVERWKSSVKQNFLSLIESEASIKAGNNLDVNLTIELIKEKEYRIEKQSDTKKKTKKRVFRRLIRSK